MNHHQIAVEPLQLLLVCFDLHLPRYRLLLCHVRLSLDAAPKLPQRATKCSFARLVVLPIAIVEKRSGVPLTILRVKYSLLVLLTIVNYT